MQENENDYERNGLDHDHSFNRLFKRQEQD